MKVDGVEECVARDIKLIEDTFPCDAEDSELAEIGAQLLVEAISDWRELPADILKTYAELCAEKYDLECRIAEGRLGSLPSDRSWGM